MTSDLTGPRLLQQALQIAAAAHTGQRDATGAPYLGHINRVTAYAEMFRTQHDPTLDRFVVGATAVLHDVLEDSDLGPADLRRHGIPDHVVAGVQALTHAPHEPRADYLARVQRHDLAIVVKWADTWDNADPRRLAAVADPARRERLALKYAAAFTVLRGVPLAGSAPRWPTQP